MVYVTNYKYSFSTANLRLFFCVKKILKMPNIKLNLKFYLD